MLHYAMPQPPYLDIIFPITRNLLGKQMGWFSGAGLIKNKGISLRESMLLKACFGSIKLGLPQLEEEQLQQM